MDILDDMGVSKLSANIFFKVNYSFKVLTFLLLFFKIIDLMVNFENRCMLVKFGTNIFFACIQCTDRPVGDQNRPIFSMIGPCQ